MRERSRDRGRLLDMQQYAKNVDVIIQGVSYDDFVSDIRIYYSTMKNIEVIGEAAYMLTSDFKTAYPELPWRQIVDSATYLYTAMPRCRHATCGIPPRTTYRHFSFRSKNTSTP